MNKTVEYLIGIVGAVFLPAGSYILLAFGLIFIDSIFGLLTMRKRNEEFSVKKLIFQGILIKLLVYSLIILALFWVDTLLLNELIPKDHLATKVGTFFILINEIASIIKHFKLLTGSNFRKNFNLLNSIITGIRKLISKCKGE